MTPSQTRILGIGKSILGDDAVGLHAARRLRDRVPARVSVLEVECGEIALVEFLAGCRRAFILDAMISRGGEPGTVIRAGLGQLWDSPGLGSARGDARHRGSTGQRVWVPDARGAGRLRDPDPAGPCLLRIADACSGTRRTACGHPTPGGAPDSEHSRGSRRKPGL